MTLDLPEVVRPGSPAPSSLIVDEVLSVVVPCFNEEATVARSVERLLAQPFIGEVIIVDDCSTDGTRSVVATLDDPRVKVAHHDRNQGKGAALRTGFAMATLPFVGVHDADLEYDPQDLGRLLVPLLEGDADVVYGSRFLTTEAHRVLYFWHSVGNKLLTLFSNMMTNLNLTDMETCYKVFRREVLEQIHIDEDRFGVEPELTSKVAAMRVRVYEIGISYHGRSYADGKKIGWRDGVRAFVAIAKHSTRARAEARRGRRDPLPFDAADTALSGTLENLDDARNYADWIGSQFVDHVRGRVLEVGAGHGTFSELLAERADELVITDPSERAAAILSRRFADRQDVAVAAEDLEAAVRRGPFDTIVLFNVLEHIEQDAGALEVLRASLNPGGKLCVFVPAFEALYSEFDRSIGHHRRYTAPLLERRLRAAGLDAVDTYYMNSLGFVAWFVVARVLGRRPTDGVLVPVFDRAVVPIMRAVEHRWRPPFGQSLVSISRRA